MTFQSKLPPLGDKELAAYGVARAKDAAFDAVKNLWERRRGEGMTQRDLAALIGRDPGWLSKCFRGPANWTFRTFGELAVGLGGDPTIIIRALEDIGPGGSNYDAWSEFDANQAGSSGHSVRLDFVSHQNG